MTEHRVAVGVPDSELASFQRAVRVLLTHGLVTARHPGIEELDAVRRWATQIAADLGTLAGYRLEISHSTIRLVRRLDRLDSTQPLDTNGRPFDCRRYAYLCLCLAALGRAGAQITLSDLAGHVRSNAAEIGTLGFDPDRYPQRLAFVDTILYLESIGAISAADGSTASWQKDPETGEALYDIDRECCHLLFLPTRVVQHVETVSDFLETVLPLGRDTRRAATRQRLVRLLVEFPVVYYDDLPDADRRYLHTEARELAADLGRLTGAQLERRAEGLALIDTGGSFSDLRFPGTGTVSHVALLLAERLVDARETAPDIRRPSGAEAQDRSRSDLDRAMPTAGRVELFGTPRVDGERSEDAASVVPEEANGAFVPDASVATWIGEIADTYPIAKEYRQDPERLAADAIALLEKFDLVRRTAGGFVPQPAVARYRIQVRTATAPGLVVEAE